jgi:hypothetical protein
MAMLDGLRSAKDPSQRMPWYAADPVRFGDYFDFWPVLPFAPCPLGVISGFGVLGP